MTIATGLPLPRTREELAERLEDACRTLRKLPSPKHSQPAGMRSNWPDYLRDLNEAYGYHTARGGRILATASEIARCDEVMAWQARAWNVASLRAVNLPDDAGAVAWLRCGAGWQMRRLAEFRIQRYGMRKPPGGTNRYSLRLMVDRALDHMLKVLGQDVRPAVIEEDDPPLVWDVVVDQSMETRVAAIRGDGTVVTQTRHARAEWREVPGRGKPKG